MQTFVGARIQQQAGQSIPNDTPTTLDYDTLIFDSGGMVDLAADDSRITITSAGLYLVVSVVRYVPNAVGRRIVIVTLNGNLGAGTGTNIGADSRPANTQVNAASNSAVVVLRELEAGDFLTSGTQQTSGGSLTQGNTDGSENSFFSVGRIGV